MRNAKQAAAIEPLSLPTSQTQDIVFPRRAERAEAPHDRSLGEYDRKMEDRKMGEDRGFRRYFFYRSTSSCPFPVPNFSVFFTDSTRVDHIKFLLLNERGMDRRRENLCSWRASSLVSPRSPVSRGWFAFSRERL